MAEPSKPDAALQSLLELRQGNVTPLMAPEISVNWRWMKRTPCAANVCCADSLPPIIAITFRACSMICRVAWPPGLSHDVARDATPNGRSPYILRSRGTS
jgi:hypothetical protein